MFRTLRIFALAGFALIASACSKPPQPQAGDGQMATSASTPRRATPFDAALKARKRAQDVQKTIDKQAAAQRKAIDDQSH